MSIQVLIEPVGKNGFRATSGAPLALIVEAPTREEALTKLREQLGKRLRNGVELVSVHVAAQQHPLAKFAGMFKDDPDFAAVLKIIAENRRKEDKRRKRSLTQYVMDTDILWVYQDGHPIVKRNVIAHPMSDLAVTIISVEEQLTG